MALITDLNNLFNLVQTMEWNGQYSGSQGTQDFNSSFEFQNEYVSPVQIVDTTSYAKLTHGFNTYYKLQGFNSTTGSYEVWFSRGEPLLIPPSGNLLSNIEIVLTWIDR